MQAHLYVGVLEHESKHFFSKDKFQGTNAFNDSWMHGCVWLCVYGTGSPVYNCTWWERTSFKLNIEVSEKTKAGKMKSAERWVGENTSRLVITHQHNIWRNIVLQHSAVSLLCSLRHSRDLCKAVTTVGQYYPLLLLWLFIYCCSVRCFPVYVHCWVGCFDLQWLSFEFTTVGSAWFLNCWVGCLSERDQL